MNNIILGAVLIALLILIYLLLRLTDSIQARVGDNARNQEERLDRLNTTIDHKLSASFNIVSARLEEVHQGLGSMQSLAGGVGDLKRILTNVKNRGIWGEMQLGNLLKEMLAPNQYAENVAIKPRGSERVEFALKLPGKVEGKPVWLPIDAKFPQEDFQRLIEAREEGNLEAATVALRQLELRFKSEAKDIRDKYICPPNSTDFAVMYLPVEGLFAEAVSIPGLLDELQRKYRVTVAGPTTLAALLNSLQMGFKTLAIERQTGEVWKMVATLKNDFANFADNLEKTQKKLQEAQNQLDTTADRSRIITKRLNKASELNVEDVEDKG
jgi:DNA recombination protein RmuC